MTARDANAADKAAAEAASRLSEAQQEAQRHARSIFTTQRELLDALEQMNAHWFARAKSEAELAATMAGKLAAARSMPDVSDVYREWLGRRMQRYVEDSNHVLEDVQKFIETSSRLMQNGRGAAA